MQQYVCSLENTKMRQQSDLFKQISSANPTLEQSMTLNTENQCETISDRTANFAQDCEALIQPKKDRQNINQNYLNDIQDLFKLI